MNIRKLEDLTNNPETEDIDPLNVLLELQECASYWSEYHVPLGIHDRIQGAINKLLIEPVKHEREHIADTRKMVPVEPTYEMHVAARDWSIGEYGGAMGSDASDGCYKAMLAAAPTVKKSLTVEPTDSEMLVWMFNNRVHIESKIIGKTFMWLAVRDEGDGIITAADTPRQAITKAIRGEE